MPWSGFVRRSSKFTGRHFLELLMFINSRESVPSLSDLSGYMAEVHSVTLRKQSIDGRFHAGAVGFLERVLSQLLSNVVGLSQEECPSPHFNRVLIKDSTRFNLLGAHAEKYRGYGGNRGQGAAVSIQYEYDYLSGQGTDLSLTPATRNDRRDSREGGDQIMAGDLLVRDLGYATLVHMEKVASKGAFFLNRLDNKVLVYEPLSGKEVDLPGLVGKMKRTGAGTMEPDVALGTDYRLPCRLIVSTVGEEVYKKRRARAWLSMYVTNAGAEQLPTDRGMDIYGVRWHIEPVFKAWKSICKVNSFSRARVERFECLLLAKLIWATANWNGFMVVRQWIERNGPTAARSCSVQKFYKRAARLSELLRSAIWGGKGKTTEWTRAMLIGATSLVATEKRKNRKSLRQKAENLYVEKD